LLPYDPPPLLAVFLGLYPSNRIIVILIFFASPKASFLYNFFSISVPTSLLISRFHCSSYYRIIISTSLACLLRNWLSGVKRFYGECSPTIILTEAPAVRILPRRLVTLLVPPFTTKLILFPFFATGEMRFFRHCIRSRIYGLRAPLEVWIFPACQIFSFPPGLKVRCLFPSTEPTIS